MLGEHPLPGFEERKAILASVAKAGTSWKNATFATIAVLGISALGHALYWMAPAWKPWVVELNNTTGQVRVVGPIPETFTVYELTVHTFIRQFIEAIREITEDPETIKKHWRIAKAQTTPEGAMVLAQMEAEWQPLTQREPVVVTVTHISARDKDRYDAWWIEKKYSVRHELLSTTPYRGLFTIQWQTPRTDEQRRYAPLGLLFHLWKIEQGQ